MPEIILFLVALVTIVGLITYVIILQKRYNHFVRLYARAMMDIDVLQNELAVANNLYTNDQFIKFISDSRESAYVYIEQVQEAIRDFSTKADSVIRDTNTSPNTILAYKKLLSMLPEDSKNA